MEPIYKDYTRPLKDRFCSLVCGYTYIPLIPLKALNEGSNVHLS